MRLRLSGVSINGDKMKKLSILMIAVILLGGIMCSCGGSETPTTAEQDPAQSSAVSDTVTELLPIIDNLERAEGFTDAVKVREGLVMINNSVDAVLAKLGIESFGAPGDTFDPNLHNAIMHDEDDTKGEGEITDVFQKGYKRGSKIIRFAMVKTVN